MLKPLLNKLPSKFNSNNRTLYKNILNYINKRKIKKQETNIKKAPIYFDPNITETEDTNNAIRIFKSKVRNKKCKYIDKSLQNKPAYKLKDKIIKKSHNIIYR
jgi:hypothetical protein